ncbi:MAG: two-component sensor histidine kinase [Desulfobacteraceae bacterium]|nr:two-component sensor histidine kinase [Desulfobacteraceae bacterium]
MSFKQKELFYTKKSPYAAMRRIILASMILVPLVTFIIILGVGYYYFTTSLETGTISSMKRIIEDHRHMIDTFLNERKANLEFILHSYSYEALAKPENLLSILDRLQKESSAFLDLGIFNEEGIHINYQGPYKLVGRDYGQEDWFNEVLKKGYYISDIFLGYRRIPHFIIALVREDEGRKWVIRATIDTYLFSDLVKKVRIGKTGEAYLLNKDGIFQTERRSGGNLMDKDPENIKYLSPHEGVKTFFENDFRGEEYIYATTWLKGKEWLLVVRQQKADAFRTLRSAAYLIVLITIIGSAAIIGLALYLTDRIIRRMERIDVDREQLSEQLIRASRLAELGEMSAGFAHEINNPLQIIKSEQALMETILSELKEIGELKPSESLSELEDSLHQIDLQINRCSGITQSILKFGRQSEPVYTDIALQTFIPEVTVMVENKASVHGITLRQEISEDTPFVHGDPGQLQQVLINLYNNAIDAIIARHGTEEGELVIGAGPKENGKVEIFVKDNGVGISPENQDKIFRPFFSTKSVGNGTGLGLSVCYGIIDSMGGTMEVSSEEDVGTIFTIHLPANQQINDLTI